MLTKFASLPTLEVPKMIISCATSDHNIVKMTFPFQGLNAHPLVHVSCILQNTDIYIMLAIKFPELVAFAYLLFFFSLNLYKNRKRGRCRCQCNDSSVDLKVSSHLKAHRGTNFTLQWRHDERDGVSNLNCLFNRLFRRRSKKTLNLRVTGLCDGNSPVTGEFPAQRASKAENASISWRHHEWNLGQNKKPCFPKIFGKRHLQYSGHFCVNCCNFPRITDNSQWTR